MERRTFLKAIGAVLAAPAALAKAAVCKPGLEAPVAMPRKPLHLIFRKELDKAISIVKRNELFNRNENLRIFVTTKAYNLIGNGSIHELSRERYNKIKKGIERQPRINYEYRGITLIEKTLHKEITFFVCYGDNQTEFTRRIGFQLDDNGSVVRHYNWYERRKKQTKALCGLR